MRRMILPVLALVAMVVAVVAVPAAVHRGAGATSPGSVSTSITRYNATFEVDSSGDLTVSETLVVDVPPGASRGLSRSWDTLDENEPRARRVPEDIRVTRDGRPASWEHSTRDAGRFHVATIGGQDGRLSPGLHTYVIDYEVEDVLLEGDDGSSVFAWDVVPRGWAQEIRAATLTVRLPAETSQVRCSVGGAEGSDQSCQVEGAGGRTLRVSAGPLPPDTAVALRTTVDLERMEPRSFAPWSASLAPVLGTSGLLLALVLIGIGWSAFTGFRLARLTRGSAPSFGVTHAPPPGMAPTQGAYLLTESIEDRALLAGLMHAADRGAIELAPAPAGWCVTERDPHAWRQVDPGTRAGLASLGVAGGGSFQALRGSVSSGEALEASLAATEQATRAWARGEHLVIRAGWASLGGVAVVAGFVAFGVAFRLLFEHLTLVALVPGAFAATALPMLYPGSATMRTHSGRELWSHIGGFGRMLRAPSSQAPFGFAGHEQLFGAHLPWAVALGCADQWAAKFRAETGHEPPVPDYLGSHAGSHPLGHVERVVGDLTATLDSALCAARSARADSG